MPRAWQRKGDRFVGRHAPFPEYQEPKDVRMPPTPTVAEVPPSRTPPNQAAQDESHDKRASSEAQAPTSEGSTLVNGGELSAAQFGTEEQKQQGEESSPSTVREEVAVLQDSTAPASAGAVEPPGPEELRALNVPLKWHSAEQPLALGQVGLDNPVDGIGGEEAEGGSNATIERMNESQSEPSTSTQPRARSEPDPQLQQVVKEREAFISILSDEYFPSDPENNAWFHPGLPNPITKLMRSIQQGGIPRYLGPLRKPVIAAVAGVVGVVGDPDSSANTKNEEGTEEDRREERRAEDSRAVDAEMAAESEINAEDEARLLAEEPMETDETRSNDEAWASLQAQKELDDYIGQKESPKIVPRELPAIVNELATSDKTRTLRVPPMQHYSRGQPAKGWLPVVVDASSEDDLEWDREVEGNSSAPPRRSVRSVAIIPRRDEGCNRRSPARRPKKRKENPRRQLTKEDYFSTQPSPPRSITPPPAPIRGRRNVDQVNWDDSKAGAEGRDDEVRAANRSQFPLKRRGTLAGDLQPVPINPLVDPPPFACFNCWQEGHRMKQCPRPVKRSFCRNCGRSQVEERTCPRCSQLYEAHQAELRERRSRDSSRADNSRQRYPEDSRGRSRSNVRDYQDQRREQDLREQERREQERRAQERREQETRQREAERTRREFLFQEEARLRQMQQAREEARRQDELRQADVRRITEEQRKRELESQQRAEAERLRQAEWQRATEADQLRRYELQLREQLLAQVVARRREDAERQSEQAQTYAYWEAQQLSRVNPAPTLQGQQASPFLGQPAPSSRRDPIDDTRTILENLVGMPAEIREAVLRRTFRDQPR